MQQQEAKFGLTKFAEVWNGRLAMLGFLAFATELLTGHGILHQVGLM
ncbi:MAG: high light inducible protein [Symploca sp. SIO2E6]|nr:high light inducible protein [Symploca sp. SIO2E6]